MTTDKPNDSPAVEQPTADSDGAVQVLDATQLTCPMPLLKAKQALNKLAAGERLRVRATDPGSVRDFEVFARQSGHLLLQSSVETAADSPEVFVYLLQKKAG